MTYPCGHESVGHNDGPCCEVCRLSTECDALRAQRDDFADRHATLAQIVVGGLREPWDQLDSHEAARRLIAERDALRADVARLRAHVQWLLDTDIRVVPSDPAAEAIKTRLAEVRTDLAATARGSEP